MTYALGNSGGLAIAILGAGFGSRFGGDKLNAECAERPLGEWAIRAAAQMNVPIAVVVGAGSHRFAHYAAADLTLISNPDPVLGQGSSLVLAARWSSDRGHERLMIMLADMPLVSTDTLVKLAARCGKMASACLYHDGRPGVPACFGAGFRERLMRLPGTAGAAALLAELGSAALVCPDPRELLDVDRPEDLELAAHYLLGCAPAVRN